MKKDKELAIKHATVFAVYLLLIWGFYRLLFKLPEEIEEVFLKPIIWLVPIFFLLKKERLGFSSLGITLKNLFPAIYFSLGLGTVFALEAVVLNFIKYGNFVFAANIGEKSFLPALGLSFATAFSEEIAFRGYLFNRVWQVLDNEWLANFLTSLVWMFIHIPVAIFVWRYDIVTAGVYFFITILFGIGSAFVFARTRNVFSSIFLHVLWEWPIILFR